MFLVQRFAARNNSITVHLCCYYALSSSSSSSSTSNKLFVGGLSWAVDEKSLKEGFSSFGDVSEERLRSVVAHRGVDAVMGPRTVQHETVESKGTASATPTHPSGVDACNIHTKAFQGCLNNYGSEISKCQFYLDMLAECHRNYGAVMGA